MNPEEFGIYKYKQLLMATIKDALESIGYGNAKYTG